MLKIEIKLLAEFRSLYRHAINTLVELATGLEDMINKTHIIVKFAI